MVLIAILVLNWPVFVFVVEKRKHRQLDVLLRHFCGSMRRSECVCRIKWWPNCNLVLLRCCSYDSIVVVLFCVGSVNAILGLKKHRTLAMSLRELIAFGGGHQHPLAFAASGVSHRMGAVFVRVVIARTARVVIIVLWTTRPVVGARPALVTIRPYQLEARTVLLVVRLVVRSVVAIFIRWFVLVREI